MVLVRLVLPERTCRGLALRDIIHLCAQPTPLWKAVELASQKEAEEDAARREIVIGVSMLNLKTASFKDMGIRG